MASSTKVTQNRAKAKHRKTGHKRKVKLEKNGTTPPAKVLFGDAK